jgi:MoaA/NifB/PqqE/SkfB family radical SAM enzyme
VREIVKYYSPFRQRAFSVSWVLTNQCNYACSYCPEWLHAGSLKRPETWEMWLFLRKVLSKCRRDKKSLMLEFTGGEVTLCPDLLQIVDRLKSSPVQCRVLVTSNGHRSLEWWRKNAPLFDMIILSYHSEFTDERHMLELCRLLREQRALVYVNVMMLPARFSQAYEFAQRLRDEVEVGISLQRLQADLNRYDDEVYPYTDEMRRVMLQFRGRIPDYYSRLQTGELKAVDSGGQEHDVDVLELLQSGRSCWRGWWCSAGEDQLRIDPAGSILRCWCGQGGTMGNIRAPRLSLDFGSVVCDRRFCSCLLDFFSAKQRPGPRLGSDTPGRWLGPADGL